MDALSERSPKERLLGILYKAIYIAAIGFFLLKVYQYHHLNFGYSALPMFSQNYHGQSLDIIKETPHFTFPGNAGYDGQFYAQLALHPDAKGPEIEQALDNYSYRSRRILFSWTAWAFGFGNPYWIIQAYAIQNALFWVLTAALLLRWLPPQSGQNTLRFLFCLFTTGLVYSFNRALLDGPSLFLIALGALCIESNRSWLGAAILGLAGLGKETNLLAITALWKPNAKDSQSKTRIVCQATLATLPFILWYAYILSSNTDRISETVGLRNFALPLVGFFSTALQILKEGGETGFPARMYAQFAMLASLIIQGAYLLFRPKPDRVWWRIGVTFTVLMLILGDAVWAGVEAAPRVLLPMTIAFNILFSRKFVFFPILFMANSLSLVGLLSLQPPNIPERYETEGRLDLSYDAENNEYTNLVFSEGWYANEVGNGRHWRWSSGSGKMSFRVPGERKIKAIFSFIPKTIDEREMILQVNGEAIWQYSSPGGYGESQTVSIILKAGENSLILSSPQSPIRIGEDPRNLSFALYDYQINILSVTD